MDGRCSIQHIITSYYKHLVNLSRLVLAKYDVKQHKIQKSELHEAGSNQYDVCFHPEDCREELEVSLMCFYSNPHHGYHYTTQLWDEKNFPKEVVQTRPTKSEYLYMQSCVTSPLQLEGEEEPLPAHPWQTAEELMEGFDDFLKAAFDIANALESMD